MGGVSSQGRLILPLSSGKAVPEIVPPHPSHPIMRRPGADLEEKPEPRVALLAEAQNGDGMRQSGRGLTRAAIEKPTLTAPGSNGEVGWRAAFETLPPPFSSVSDRSWALV